MSVALETLLDAAPYLAGLAEQHPGWFTSARAAGPDAALAGALAEVKAAGLAAGEEPELAAALRLAKGRVALLAAWAETSGTWTTAQSTAALSDLADAALDAGLEFLVRRAHVKGDMIGPLNAAQCGLAIFALGKHGGRELNYS